MRQLDKGVFMKLIISTLIALSFSLAAKAADVKAIATVSGLEQGLKEVSLLTNDTLKIVNTKDEVKILKLSVPVVAKLTDNVTSLSNVELEESNKVVVCMMMKLPSLSNLSVANYDYEKSVYSDELTLVLTDSGCSIHHVVFPKESYMLSYAEQLRTQLVILALNTLKK